MPDEMKNAGAADSGTEGIGKGLNQAADKNDRDHAAAWAKHNAGAGKKESYAAELGQALNKHAQEPGTPFSSDVRV
jgi:hypothetical protein